METAIMIQIEKVLKEFPQYWEQNSLLKVKVIEDLRNYRADLIERLLANKTIKNAYALEISNGYVFKTEEFISMLRYKNYWENSYTKFSNEIGLTSDEKYLKYNPDVVIDFPHKDCVLEGGMTKEDTGKKEIFYHKILAREEIDVLLAPKVLTNVKRYTPRGVENPIEITVKDNLIIKGNNLIALHSLKERFAGEVKLIVIDPPYNTGGDSFKYNDRFNHSTWLTFMKNRLEVARELLAEDGSIWITIDDDESHYLKVLCDEVFGRENFINNVIWEKKFSPQNDAKWLSDSHDHILVFAKNKEIWRPNLLPRNAEMDSRYKNPDNDPRGPWTSGDMSVKTYNPSTDYTITTPSGRKVNPPAGYCWRVSKEKFKEMIADNRIWFGTDGNNVPRIKRFLSEVKSGVTAMTLWKHSEVGHNQDAKREVNDIDGVSLFSTPKPERLLQRIIYLGSNEGDIVLDFFMGSATTQAVAMKMGRQFIGIEQMDYIEDVSVPRLRRVLEGEQGGISKDVKWMGGGSFLYAELQELNQRYISLVQCSKTNDELEEILKKIKMDAYFDFKVTISRLTLEDSEFNTLSLADKKQLVIQSLDANQMYLNYSEIDDSNYAILDNIKEFNHSFYQKLNDGEKL
ncbi:site-specific DNA-methyltransferase [Bacillus cereus]|uniref:site-specific DNA-methyltransferase n=1 Tax=Bacillus cereus TaxID=1396 RepID=UPI0024BC9D88|nr:site-specific DNA-methyltransferase [Bacillus cereus]